MSSAYKCTDRPCFKTIYSISLVYRIYKRRPNNEPWGTPKCSLLVLPSFLFTHMLKVLFVRYELNHLKTLSQILKSEFSRCKSKVWSTVSNADDKSSDTRIVCFFLE